MKYKHIKTGAIALPSVKSPEIYFFPPKEGWETVSLPKEYFENSFDWKKEIFVTEDRVSVFADDKYYFVQTHLPKARWAILDAICPLKHDGGHVGTKRFHSIKKASEFIKLNASTLLKTEDGVFIYPGDIVYIINKTNLQAAGYMTLSDKYTPKDHHLYFSTSEAVNSYIEENSPKYSVKDIKRLKEFLSIQTPYLSTGNFIKILNCERDV